MGVMNRPDKPHQFLLTSEAVFRERNFGDGRFQNLLPIVGRRRGVVGHYVSVGIKIFHHVPVTKQREDLKAMVRQNEGSVGDLVVERGIKSARRERNVELAPSRRAVAINIWQRLAETCAEQGRIGQPVETRTQVQVAGLERGAVRAWRYG